MRFGVTPCACKQALDLSFELKQSILRTPPQEDAHHIQQQAQESLQKVSVCLLPESSVSGQFTCVYALLVPNFLISAAAIVPVQALT